MQQQITRGDYLEDLITIYIDNNLQQSLDDLYSMFVFQCGEIQKQLTPAQVIKISFTEQESQLLTNYNTCYLAGITKDGHKETFNGSLTFNTRGEVVKYEPAASTITPSGTSSTCDCQGLRGVYSNCCQPAIKAYFSLNYVPTKLSELINDTDFVDSVDVAESISIHNASTEAHPYIQSTLASATEALTVSIQAETTAREEAVSLAISTTEAYADSIVTQATEATKAYADSIVSTATTATEAYTDSLVQSATTAINTTIGDLSQLDTSVKSSVTNAINAEVATRLSADNNLQGQIDALAAASDVTDIVGTYAELQAYDTQHLNDNDIIKVLSDSTHQDQPSYYRFDKETDTFSYIGSEDAGYTKAQADAKFVTQTTTVNGKALSSDISLTYSDVNALPATTQTIIDAHTSAIAANTSAIAANTTVIAQHTTAIATNTSAISTINGKIPTDASSSNKLVSASALSASIADFANQDLSNLTNNGEARLHALKSYADKGELLTDADGLSFVKSYAHSTFDRSKFTVVGSPNITDDGIISFWNNSNKITYGTINGGGSTNYEIHYRLLTPSHTFTSDDLYTQPILISNSGNTNWTLQLYSQIKTNLSAFEAGYSYVAIVDNIATLNIAYVDIVIKNNGANFTISTYRPDGMLIKTATSTTAGAELPFETLTLYTSNNAFFTTGIPLYQIDSKYFSVIIDGVEVFSGNRTGIDTIKPDDYTVVGTPTISADGVASGLNGANYLMVNNSTLGSSLHNANSWKIIQEFTYNGGNDWAVLFSCTGHEGVSTFILPSENNSLGYVLSSDGINEDISNAYSLRILGLILGNTYKSVLEFTGTQYIHTLYNSDGTQFGETKTVTSSIKVVNSTNYYIGSRNSFYGPIDLNAFKIYVDGNLVYQPCLKIPYTESKTGSKIVDSIYRDRVNDMAEQFGFANYYTLSDTDFTLPQVELYGLIGQRTLRDSYRNGINYWELYSNRDLEQGGSCTSGVEVTFARPFADTNYVLSVPYSAKSATAFTPTQTGDWITKGKGLL